MARKSEARNRSIVGMTREARIYAMVASGWTNEAILGAFELEDAKLIKSDDPRRNGSMAPFDPLLRQRTQEAIRSSRKQDADKEVELTEFMEANGPRKGVKALAESELENLHRFECGVPAIDFIYGTSKFVHLTDDPKNRWYRGDPMIPDGHGSFVLTRYDSGEMETVVLKRGDKPVTRRRFDFVDGLNRKHQITEHGMPESFLSIWGGAPGVGKSRLAVAVCKSLNRAERRISEKLGVKPRPILYFNGEAAESQFTQWAGVVDPELFLASHDENIRLDDIASDIYEYQPRVVILDSFQMIAEVKKSPGRVATVLSRFKQLKVDKEAGMPHIVIISQLNKQEELAGSRFLEYMVDFSAKATSYEGRKGTFLFECRSKNRGGETPRGAIFRHQEDGLECVSTDVKSSSLIKLTQPSAPVAVPATLANNPHVRGV